MWPADTELMSARRLADKSAVSATTIKNWTLRAADPLPTHRHGGRTVYRWGDLVAFVNEHPGLPAAAKTAARLRRPEHHRQESSAQDIERLEEIARSARKAATAAVNTAVRAAESHLDSLRELRNTIAALDAALERAMSAVPYNK
ncbi:hypothetical protein [Mycobacteroides abscessus]|nr:hypothetical protein [Mycobacteroides abscessus]MDO3079895.1 hypothetical protein [Mycobacteroides abscessus subsp. bolletii]